MALHIFRSIADSGSVPNDWKPNSKSGVTFRVRNKRLLRYLRELRCGRWCKVLKGGSTGEVHFFRHESGVVAGVKFIPKDAAEHSSGTQA
jgi:hypothetical protein